MGLLFIYFFQLSNCSTVCRSQRLTITWYVYFIDFQLLYVGLWAFVCHMLEYKTISSSIALLNVSHAAFAWYNREAEPASAYRGSNRAQSKIKAYAFHKSPNEPKIFLIFCMACMAFTWKILNLNLIMKCWSAEVQAKWWCAWEVL